MGGVGECEKQTYKDKTPLNAVCPIHIAMRVAGRPVVHQRSCMYPATGRFLKGWASGQDNNGVHSVLERKGQLSREQLQTAWILTETGGINTITVII